MRTCSRVRHGAASTTARTARAARSSAVVSASAVLPLVLSVSLARDHPLPVVVRVPPPG